MTKHAVQVRYAEKWGSPNVVLVPDQRAAVDREFQRHLKEHHSASPSDRQPCHIIACYVGDDGVVCYYHCIKE